MDSIEYFYILSRIRLCIDVRQSEYSLERGVVTNSRYFDILRSSELEGKDGIRHGEEAVFYIFNKPY